MKLNIEELAREAGFTYANWSYNQTELESFARLIVERCAVELDKRYMGDNNREDM